MCSREKPAYFVDERPDLTNYRRNNMKKLTLTLCALTVLVSTVVAGTETYSGKEMKQVQTPCPQWYADNEWDIGVSGIYGTSVNGGDGRGGNFNFNNSFSVQ